MDHLRADSMVQLGIVVPDCDKAAENFCKYFGLDFDDYVCQIDTHDLEEQFGNTTSYNGKPSEWYNRMAIINYRGMQYEFITPLGPGENDYAVFLEKTGGGVHHIHMAFKHNGYDEFLQFMKDNKVPTVVSGFAGGSNFTYFDFRKDFGLIIETSDMTDENYKKNVAACGPEFEDD